MKVCELRYGNWVTDEFYDHFKTVIKVTSINEKGINLSVEDDGNYPECAIHFIEPEYTFDKLYGITLSPEILEKAGFIVHKSYSGHIEYRKGSMFISSTVGRFWFEWPRRKETLPGTPSTEFKYVHEFQNLYYFLTGTDLSLQL